MGAGGNAGESEEFSCTGCGSGSLPRVMEVQGGRSDGPPVPPGLGVGVCLECSRYSIWAGGKEVRQGRRVPSRPYRLSRNQAEDGARLCGVKVTQLLNDIETLCHAGGNEATAAFLYTIALEEFGKALLLRELLSKGPPNSMIDVPRAYFFGRKAHKKKMDMAKKALPDECILSTNLGGYRSSGAGSESIARECDEAVRGIKNSAEKVLGMRGQPVAYDMQRRSHMMATKGGRGGGNGGGATAGMPEAVYYDEQTRYNKMYVDWDDKNGRWNAREAIGPLRITMPGDGPAFDVEVDRGERKRYPHELIRAVASFRRHLDESGILSQTPLEDGGLSSLRRGAPPSRDAKPA